MLLLLARSYFFKVTSQLVTNILMSTQTISMFKSSIVTFWFKQPTLKKQTTFLNLHHKPFKTSSLPKLTMNYLGSWDRNSNLGTLPVSFITARIHTKLVCNNTRIWQMIFKNSWTTNQSLELKISAINFWLKVMKTLPMCKLSQPTLMMHLD